jgi:hypothetical protein
MLFSAREYLPRGYSGMRVGSGDKPAQTEQPSGWGLGYLSRKPPLQPNALCGAPDAQAIDDETRRRKNAAGCGFACEDMEHIRVGRIVKRGKAVRYRFFREEGDEGATNLLGAILLSRRTTPGAGASGVMERLAHSHSGVHRLTVADLDVVVVAVPA